MLRLRFPSNKFQKRLLRAVYGQTQAYPYAATLDASFRSTDGLNTLILPTAAGATNPTRSADAFTLQGGLVPGTVVIASGTGETVKVAAGNGTNAGEKPFGLLGNFVGGNLDELGDNNEVGVWRGWDGVFDLLAPAFDTTNITPTAVAAATPGLPKQVTVAPSGLLTLLGGAASPAGATSVGNIISINSAGNVLRVDLKI